MAPEQTSNASALSPSLHVRAQLVRRVIPLRGDVPCLLAPLQSQRLLLPLPFHLSLFPLVLLPNPETAFPPRTWFAALSYRM